ncbi:uncharacterized protein LOC132612064 [Lycium barbarum]|uniref:uncharacterized protein LOC132612064 n=1 Tax=Lycium barbarum TaxID=112863 RepID=UPI00293EAF7E|nr:uncharacterized protein LOC132612064 [Lycium barbarum]
MQLSQVAQTLPFFPHWDPQASLSPTFFEQVESNLTQLQVATSSQVREDNQRKRRLVTEKEEEETTMLELIRRNNSQLEKMLAGMEIPKPFFILLKERHLAEFKEPYRELLIATCSKALAKMFLSVMFDDGDGYAGGSGGYGGGEIGGGGYGCGEIGGGSGGGYGGSSEMGW